LKFCNTQRTLFDCLIIETMCGKVATCLCLFTILCLLWSHGQGKWGSLGIRVETGWTKMAKPCDCLWDWCVEIILINLSTRRYCRIVYISPHIWTAWNILYHMWSYNTTLRSNTHNHASSLRDFHGVCCRSYKHSSRNKDGGCLQLLAYLVFWGVARYMSTVVSCSYYPNYQCRN
jgi:hypothetical protein